MNGGYLGMNAADVEGLQGWIVDVSIDQRVKSCIGKMAAARDVEESEVRAVGQKELVWEERHRKTQRSIC